MPSTAELLGYSLFQKLNMFSFPYEKVETVTSQLSTLVALLG